MQFLDTLTAQLQGLAGGVAMVIIALATALAILSCWRFVLIVWRA